MVLKPARLSMMCFIVHKMPTVLCIRDDSVGYDTGFLSSCNLQLLDLTVRSDAISNLKLLLIMGKANEFHTFYLNQSTYLLSDPVFKKDYKTVMFIHGFIENTKDQLVGNIVSAYSRIGGYNIIILDANPSTWLDYFRAARAARNVGESLGFALYRLSRRGLNISNFTLIGHSLGAHIAGFAGRTFRKRSGKKLPFMVALDPAGPCFRNASKRDRIAASDASFVEVIHTNGVGLGLMNAVGDVDFYFNGGRFQNTFPGEKCGALCSHLRAVSLWAAAIENNNKFIGLQCNSLVEMDFGNCFGGKRNVAFVGPATLRNTTGVYLVRFMRVFRYFMPFNNNLYGQAKKWFGFSNLCRFF